jgi:outer membrane receptor protein involved in Fe transport
VDNIISAKPKFNYEANLSADLGNYSSSRLEGLVNIPLVEDKVALRLAGAWTKRDGYATNQLSGNPIDGRDLWSTRLSLRVAPTDAINMNLIWEHFEENDDRLRSGKQLCTKDVVTDIAGFPVGLDTTLHEYTNLTQLYAGAQATFSQGCHRGSLYSPDAFQTPNGYMLPYYLPLGSIFLPTARTDPYVSTVQSQDLRTIESSIDPDYRAKSDLGELQVSFDLTDNLTLTSETAYSTDAIYSLEDFNRFNTAPGAWDHPNPDGSVGAGAVVRPGVLEDGPNGGIFCDPQLGCSDRLVAVDVSTAKSRNLSQEFRLSSNYDGPFNFSLGANFLRYDTEDKYYVFINSLSIISVISPFNHSTAYSEYIPGVTDNRECLKNGYNQGNPNGAYQVADCTYIDPNPINSVNDQGHNYFLSRNPYKLISYAAFGEAYYNLTDKLKITAGLRWTVDKKEAPRIPTWLLASQAVGMPVAEVIEQEWREPTGRLAIDWKPDLSFTDQTLVYASYARGYKAGGANPPTYVKISYSNPDAARQATRLSETRPRTFEPEFINAFELGAKNTLADGRMTLNLAGFYYDYTGYQLSEIVDRSAFNRNYDATVWGLEVEADWRPMENLRLGFKGGYEKTRIADGERAIDLMDRTAGNPDWLIYRPFPTFASSCVLPKWLFVGHTSGPEVNPGLVNVGGMSGGNSGGCELAYYFGYDPATAKPYVADPYNTPGSGAAGSNIRSDIDYASWSNDPADYPCWPTSIPTGGTRDYPGVDPQCLVAMSNNGEGFTKDLSGNDLPNAPHYTATVTADYTLPLANNWLMTLHSDVHWQSQSWWRVFNDSTFDKLHPYFTTNIAAIFANEDAGWNIMAYIKNVTDETALTGAFLNSDDTGLTTNVFLTEPRLYGLRVTKAWTGGSLLGSFGQRHEGPYPFTLELGGQVQRHDAPSDVYVPGFAGAFDPTLDPSQGQRDGKPDWGDGRDVKLSYSPSGSWRASLGVRFGRTNEFVRKTRSGENIYSCIAPAFVCAVDTTKNLIQFNNYGSSDYRGVERHVFVDFLIGRDVGFGVKRGEATLSAGLRYAELESSADLSLSGTPDWQVPAVNMRAVGAKHHEYRGVRNSDRTFRGFGPVISWDASLPLLENDDWGAVALDWSLSGGVLFGRQKTSLTGQEQVTYWNNQRSLDFPEPPTYEHSTPFAASRSRSVTVPTAGASLGLAYKLDRFQLGAGYRWERYFDAIDGGYAEHKSYDRTIDGPYFKIAVGFGG